MKIRLYSDIHLDWYVKNTANVLDTLWYPPVLPDDKETILVLAGDIWVGTKWIEYAGASWIEKVAPRFRHVIIVLGNHDYWPNGNLTIVSGGSKCNAMLQDRGISNVHVLDASTLEIDDVLFVGATLWTDMSNGCPLAIYNMPNFMRYDGKIVYDTFPFIRFSSEYWIRTHKKHKQYIDTVAKNNRDKKIIVITHHMPLLHLVDECYRGDQSNVYYTSELSDIIIDNKNIVAWMCGHSHVQRNEMFEHCLILMNAVGYKNEYFQESNMVKHCVFNL